MTAPRPASSDAAATTAQLPAGRPWRRRTALLVAVLITLCGMSLGSHPAAAAESFTFSGSGWGHGVGMSQWGARGMAEQGAAYDDIIRFYYTGASVQSRAVSDDLRVLVAQQQPSVTVTAVGGPIVLESIGTVPNGSSVTFTRSGSSIALSGALNTTSTTGVSIRYSGSSVRVSSTGETYRYGRLVVRSDTTGLRAIVSDLPMQQYLYGLGEMSASWPREALRAQATASRTFAQKRRAERTGADFDLYGSVLHQAYTGTRHEDPRWTEAVDSTDQVVVTYQGNMVDTFYSASSGGHTENSEVVWYSPLPYLRGKPDPFDKVAGNPHNSWTRTYSGQQLGAWFGLGTVTSVQILGDTGVSGRVDKATIRLTGTGGTRDVSGPSFRSTVNANSPSAQLMSTKFSVVK